MWQIEPVAIGATVGASRLLVTRDTQFSSLLRPSAAAEVYGESAIVDSEVPIRMETLDSVAPRLSLTTEAARLYIKVDVQGSELDVIAGAKAVLVNAVVLEIELSLRPLYTSGPSIENCLEVIRATGFTPAIFLENNSHDFPHAADVNAVFVRTSERGAHPAVTSS
jgi:FkbM family methyltransferase